MENKLYSFIMRGELTKVSLDGTEVISKYHTSEMINREIIKNLSLDMLDDELICRAKLMATVYTAIAAFENTVREFVVKKLLEYKGESWWQDCVSAKIREKAESRKLEEEKIRWHTPRGVNLINYTEFGDLASIMQQNFSLFEDHIISVEWARQIFNTLERSRNVIMHSGDLGLRDIERIGINIRDWINQVGA